MGDPILSFSSMPPRKEERRHGAVDVFMRTILGHKQIGMVDGFWGFGYSNLVGN